MVDLYTKKDIKQAKIAMIKDSRYSFAERKKSSSSFNEIRGMRKGSRGVKKIVKGMGLSSSDSSGVMGILSGSNKNSSSRQSSQEVSSKKTSSKPKTSWWQSLRGGSKSSGSSLGGRSDLGDVRSRPGSSSYTSSRSDLNRSGNASREDGLSRPSPSARGSQPSGSARRSSLPSGPRILH